MKKICLSLFVSLFFSLSVFSQTDVKSVELLSPLNVEGMHDYVTARQSSFSFISQGYDSKFPDLFYGNLRVNDEWDWFYISGLGNRNKIKNIGKKDWTDNFKIPVIEPYPKLKEGERRKILVDTSGRNGASFSLSRGENGTSAVESNVYVKELPPVSQPTETMRQNPEYKAFEKAILGNMYVMRVVDETHDFYVLFRVDEIERGKRVKISWKKVDAPIEK